MNKSPHRIKIEDGVVISPKLQGNVTFVTAPEPREWSRKLLRLGAVLIAAAAFGYCLPVYAQGSMAPEVRVIVVKPSATILRLSAERDRVREQRAAERRAASEARAAERAAIRAAERARRDADRAYEKKLAAQRKARNK